MYGSTWPLLLTYGSHDMRHTGFPQVDGGQQDPREMGRHALRGKLIHGMMYMGNVIAWLLRGKISCMA